MTENLWPLIDNYLRANDIDGAALDFETRLRASKSERFASLADSYFTNSPSEVLTHINAFIEGQKQFDVQAVYLEMNGFYINYSRWFFDLFAYPIYSDNSDDLEWLCDWESSEWPDFTLVGLEQTQDDFRWYSENAGTNQKTDDNVKEIADLLVMVRFLQLIRSSLSAGTLARSVPILATAHDFDILGRFMPKSLN